MAESGAALRIVEAGATKPTKPARKLPTTSAEAAIRKRGFTVDEAAEILEWSTGSIRRHLITIEEWREKGGHPSGYVPHIRKGGLVKIPAWWVAEQLAQLEESPTIPPRMR